jgi:shikimate kinase
MPGAGKSYWAEQIAAVYPLRCIDLDHIIRVRTGDSISAFFKRYGESAFRDLEASTLQQVIEVFPKDTVVACGGGTPCFGDNLQRMKQAGRVVYLKADIPWLLQNIRDSGEERPLLAETDPQLRLETLLEARSGFYGQADLILDAATARLQDFGFPPQAV